MPGHKPSLAKGARETPTFDPIAAHFDAGRGAETGVPNENEENVKFARHWLESVPYALPALPLRLAVATVFWNSGMNKLANWDTAVALFTDEYRLPLLPPELAATMAARIELSTPVLLVPGLLIRPTAAVLLGMAAVIEIFVYPLAWPTHIQWAAVLFAPLCRAPEALSLDHLPWQKIGHRGA